MYNLANDIILYACYWAVGYLTVIMGRYYLAPRLIKGKRNMKDVHILFKRTIACMTIVMVCSFTFLIVFTGDSSISDGRNTTHDTGTETLVKTYDYQPKEVIQTQNKKAEEQPRLERKEQMLKDQKESSDRYEEVMNKYLTTPSQVAE